MYPEDVVDLIDRALSECDRVLSRVPIDQRREFERVRDELLSWRTSVQREWPPGEEFLEETATLGVYAAREISDFDLGLADAIAAVRGALRRQ